MTQTVNYPLSSTFAGVSSLQAMGTSGSGNSLPDGISPALTIANGVMVSSITQDMPTTFTGIRSEILMPVEPATGEAWFAYEFMLPSANFVPLLDPIVIQQIHTADDLGAVANPFILQYNQDGTISPYVPLSVGSMALSTKPAGSVRATLDHWYKAVLRANWQTDATGFLEFYLDGMPLCKIPGANTYTDASAGYFKCGAYDGTHNARFGSNCSIYYRNVARWSDNAGYQTVIGGLPQPQRSKLEV